MLSDDHLIVAVVSVLAVKLWETVAYLGIFVNAIVSLPEIVPRDTPPHVISRAMDAEIDIDLEPSVLCPTVCVLLIRVLSPLPPIEPLHVYLVLFIVHDADFDALDEIADGLFNTKVIDNVDVLLAVLVAVSLTVRTP